MADSRLQQLAKTDRNPIEETEYQGLLKGGGGAADPTGIDFSKIISGQRANDATFLSGQSAQTNDFLKRYSDTISAQPTQSAIADRIGQELGLPGLQATSNSLQDTLFKLPETYGSATRGFDVNSNQLAGIIAQKQKELAPSAALAAKNAGDAQNNVTTRLGYAVADENKALLPFQTEGNMLSDRLARETTLYSTENQGELNGLIAKMNAGVTLSEGEKNRANQLAIAEAGYQNALAVAKQNNSQPVSVGEGSSLVDPVTGKIIASIPKTYAPGTGTSGTNDVISFGNGSNSSNTSFDWSRYGL